MQEKKNYELLSMQWFCPLGGPGSTGETGSASESLATLTG